MGAEISNRTRSPCYVLPRSEWVTRSSSATEIATIRSSFVGTTQADTGDDDFEMQGPPASFAASSSPSPSQVRPRQIRARITAACSPIPPVNTMPSTPPSAAASEPVVHVTL